MIGPKTSTARCRAGLWAPKLWSWSVWAPLVLWRIACISKLTLCNHTLHNSLQLSEVHGGLCKCWVLPFLMSPVAPCQVVLLHTNPSVQCSYKRTPTNEQIAAGNILEPLKYCIGPLPLCLFGNYLDQSAHREGLSYIYQLFAHIQCSKSMAWPLDSWCHIAKMTKQAMPMHIFSFSTIYISNSSSFLRYSIAVLAGHRHTILYLYTAINNCCLLAERS